MGIDEGAVAIHGADAVGVSIKREACVEFALHHGALQCCDVRLDRLRIHAAEERIAHAANFFTGNLVTAEKIAQQAATSAVHGIDNETEFGGAQAIPVHESV